MVSDSAPSSRASIVSVDPAVASQITGTTQTSSPPSRSHRGSSPANRSKTPETVTTRGGHGRTKSAPNRTEKKRSASLRHAKNSTEVLRQRSTRSTKQPSQLDKVADSRGGRNFSIGNVGTGGMLYLRPSANKMIPLPAPSPTAMPLTAPATLHTVPTEAHVFPASKYPEPSNSPATAFRPGSPKRSMSKSLRRPTTETMRSRHGRSLSFSTLENNKPGYTGPISKTLRIVINRPDSDQPQDADQTQQLNLALPTLEVPIPHYRIGTPRFSSQGTPILRSSAYTRNSATPSDASHSPSPAPPGQQAPGPPLASAQAFAKLEQSGRGLAVGRPGIQIPPARPTTSSGSSNTNSTIREAVHPEIYDELAEVYDDPSVVRYSQNVREITAATPARIIAQISSESFMDYELVSDFFLTFRSYMTTFVVLDLLLARLRWAIDRLEDDGRIIRVRTFAALRHWILNYFTDDFIPDRKLRLRFCAEINKMYIDVKNRQGRGTSDLKVLRDLKRCWNGRCALFWDPAEFLLDGDQDEDLQPGGPAEGSETPVAENLALVTKPPLPAVRVKPISSSSWLDMSAPRPTQAHHERQLSTGKQESVTSDSSLQARSCSIPRGILRPNDDHTTHHKGPHPVSVQLRRKNAPSHLQVATSAGSGSKSGGHRKGSASIDSDREPTPRILSPTPRPVPVAVGSIIRGFIFAPSAPFVQVSATPVTPSMPRFDVNNLHAGGIRRGGSPNSAAVPGVKNIFGSLRKALGGRHGHSDMALVTVSAPMPLQTPVQDRANVPLNVSKSHDELRARRPPAPSKGQIRIDLLCAAVAQNYETVFPASRRPRNPSTSSPVLTRPIVDGFKTTADGQQLLVPEMKKERQTSQATAQSGSILIADATGLDIPAMSGALQSFTSLQTAWQAQANGQAQSDLGLGLQTAASITPVATQRSSDALGAEASDTLPHDHFVQAYPEPDHIIEMSQNNPRISADNDRPPSTTGSSTTMRNRRSYTSSPGVGQPKASIDNTATTLSSPKENEEDSAVKQPAQTLRRRPGGDLRKVEKVRDLDTAVHHDSMETVTTRSNESFLIVEDDPNQEHNKPPDGKKVVSMINTHSSQHLRPSFEAAVAGFSDIPDDDDGGLEATLLKLEGKYEKASPPLEQFPLDTTDRHRSMPNLSLHTPLVGSDGASEELLPKRSFAHLPPESAAGKQDEAGPASGRSSIFGLPTRSDAGSDDSEDSLPLLKRDTATGLLQPDLTKIIPSPLHLQRGFTKSRPTNPPEPPQGARAGAGDLDPRDLLRPETANESAQSFLLDEDEDMSDLSSEISVDIINYSEVMDQSLSPIFAAPGTALSGLEIPSHPLTYASVINLATEERAESSMWTRNSQMGLDRAQNAPAGALPVPRTQTTSRISGGPAHIPFVLACDSQVLAQQMTIIEKSALTEIEWSDLVEMRWENKPASVLDWAEYLIRSDIRGVDLVITRFNLVVKWTLSEIVLTQDIQERAQVITKFIHVAAHARRLHNYATMLQLTIALTSIDCTKLTKTWEMVPGPDRSLLKNMETLVQPVRNFHDLRAEMESSDMSDGCIPFIGLYVHDLTYNAQKPALVTGRRGSRDLINFERYRTAAVIVKGLLRLIDASARYTFKPVEGIVERCLWLAALKDEKIRSMSKALERA